jgi:hypothetical protein
MIIVPKRIVDVHATSRRPLFFLAGPIRGGGDWQADMAERIILRSRHSTIACPARWSAEHRLAEHFHQPFSAAENRQLVWERYYLTLAGLTPNVAGCVIFWLGLESKTQPHPGPEPYAMDTRREIGKFTGLAERGEVRMVVGGHPGFYGLDVILYELRCALGASFRFHEDMDTLVDAAIAVAVES